MNFGLSTPPTVAYGTLAAMTQPVLDAGDGLVLRPWDAADAPAFFAAYQDPAIRRWHTRRPLTEGLVLDWFDRYRLDWLEEKGGHWAATRDGDEVLGRIAMRGLNFDDGIAGFAYWVGPAARGNGVAPRALTALSNWAIGEAGFYRLHLGHSTQNEASCRVAAKSGFVLEGTLRRSAVHDDGRHDMHLHARIKDDV